MKKDVRFHWSPECQQAFDELKQKLMTGTILALPTNGEIYFLDTDASDTGLGAVLSQLQVEEERVIAYASRTLSRSERKYETTNKELLAVVYGLKQFRQYLLGRRFAIRTDHAALSWLRRTPEPMPQLARWLTFMEQFDYKVIHRPGTRHGNSDGLSRRPVAVDDFKSEQNCRYVDVEREENPGEVLRNRRNDELSEFCERLEPIEEEKELENGSEQESLDTGNRVTVCAIQGSERSENDSKTDLQTLIRAQSEDPKLGHCDDENERQQPPKR